MWTPILREVTDDDGGEKWAPALTLSREKGCPYMQQVSLPASGTGRVCTQVPGREMWCSEREGDRGSPCGIQEREESASSRLGQWEGAQLGHTTPSLGSTWHEWSQLQSQTAHTPHKSAAEGLEKHAEHRTISDRKPHWEE